MAYVEPGSDYCLNCGGVVWPGEDCLVGCRLVGEVMGRLVFQPQIESGTSNDTTR